MAAVVGAVVEEVVLVVLGLALCQFLKTYQPLLLLARLGQRQEQSETAAAAVTIVYFQQSQAQAVVVVVGRLLGSALAVAAAAAAAHGIQEAAVLVTRQAHRQVKEIMAVLALDLDRVQLMKAAVEVAQRQLVQTL